MKILRFQDRVQLKAHLDKHQHRSDEMYLVEGIGILYRGDFSGKVFSGQINAFSVVFPGDRLFQLKATHGTPLDVSLELIMNQHHLAVDWVGFIEEARLNGWWDFQTVIVIEEALSDVISRETSRLIMQRIKSWILENPI